ncbi:MAG TPA: hypothetical protein VGJ75_06060 [Dongiaceae bacterium]|jgi:hypothetical protein
MGDGRDFDSLLTYLKRVPAVGQWAGHGRNADGTWWVKFGLDIKHPLAWHVVQEFGFVLNYISLNERLPTVFKPVSPPPYLNGGPRDYLSWVIECDDPGLKPGTVMKTLEGRFPRPVDDLEQWKHHDDDEA